MKSDLPEVLLSADVVMMCGVSGAGKTTVARRLERQGYVRLSADHIVYDRYGLDYQLMSAELQHRIYMEAMDSITDSLTRLIEAGRRVVIDASMCKRARRRAVASICRAHGAGCLTVYLTADVDTLRQRLRQRLGSGPDDLKVTRQQLDSFLANFEQPGEDENFIRL